MVVPAAYRPFWMAWGKLLLQLMAITFSDSTSTATVCLVQETVSGKSFMRMSALNLLTF